MGEVRELENTDNPCAKLLQVWGKDLSGTLMHLLQGLRQLNKYGLLDNIVAHFKTHFKLDISGLIDEPDEDH